MMETSTMYPEIEKFIIDKHAGKISKQVRNDVFALLVPYFQPSYDDPFGQFPMDIDAAMVNIEAEVYVAVVKQSKNKLHQKLVEGMEALLNA